MIPTSFWKTKNGTDGIDIDQFHNPKADAKDPFRRVPPSNLNIKKELGSNETTAIWYNNSNRAVLEVLYFVL